MRHSIWWSNTHELDDGWQEHHMNVLETIKKTGHYTPPRPLHPIRRILFCQHESLDYIIHANLIYNSYYISSNVVKEVCMAYVAAFDECIEQPKKAVLIRKHLIDILTGYVKSCHHSIEGLEPQRSIVKNL